MNFADEGLLTGGGGKCRVGNDGVPKNHCGTKCVGRREGEQPSLLCSAFRIKSVAAFTRFHENSGNEVFNGRNVTIIRVC